MVAIAQRPPEEVPTSAEPGHRFGLTQAIALIMGSIIGVGIFNLPTSLSSYGPITLFSMALTTVGALAPAVLFAALSRRLPADGGPYAYARVAFGCWRIVARQPCRCGTPGQVRRIADASRRCRFGTTVSIVRSSSHWTGRPGARSSSSAIDARAWRAVGTLPFSAAVASACTSATRFRPHRGDSPNRRPNPAPVNGTPSASDARSASRAAARRRSAQSDVGVVLVPGHLAARGWTRDRPFGQLSGNYALTDSREQA
jgi:hypothetical protein